MAIHVVFAGDSITAGNHVSAGEDFPTLVGTALPAITVHNIGVPSSTCDSDGQGATADGLYVAGAINICCVLFGANDGTSKTAATFNSDLATWVAARETTGFVVIVLTMLPCGSYSSAAFRAAVNANTRSSYARVADIGALAATMGAEAATSDTQLYSDAVHPTAYGNTLIEPTVTAAVSAVLSNIATGKRFGGSFSGRIG
jgi:lysophospholipase L1-like esterase